MYRSPAMVTYALKIPDTPRAAFQQLGKYIVCFAQGLMVNSSAQEKQCDDSGGLH